MPLVVWAAGNDSIDASFGYAKLKDDYRGRILVVGASDSTGHRAAFSNYGAYIDVYAPGAGVYTYGPSGAGLAVVPRQGTSYSAPIVAGIAGLLKSFDPRLPPDTLRQLIIAGANGGNRRIGSPKNSGDTAFIANAYEALKRAATRPTAPLCDNRVWYADGQVWTRRDRANPNSDEALFAVPSSDSAGLFSPAHGGKRVDGFSSTLWDYFAFEYANGTWTLNEDFWSLPWGVDGGATNSFFSYSHDADTSASATVGTDGAIHVYRRLETSPYTQTQVTTFTPTGVPAGSADSVCVFRSMLDPSQCGYIVVGTGGSVAATTAFAPNGREILVAVNITGKSITSDTDYFQCIDDYECRQLTLTTTALGSQLWTVPLSGGTPQLRWSLSGRSIMQLAESEAGTEIVAHLAADSSRAVTGAFILTPPPPPEPVPSNSDAQRFGRVEPVFDGVLRLQLGDATAGGRDAQHVPHLARARVDGEPENRWTGSRGDHSGARYRPGHTSPADTATSSAPPVGGRALQ